MQPLSQSPHLPPSIHAVLMREIPYQSVDIMHGITVCCFLLVFSSVEGLMTLVPY